MRRSVPLGLHAYVPKGSPRVSFRATEAAARASDAAREAVGFFSLPRLSYPTASGLPAFLSAPQFRVQYDVLHRDAVDALNRHTLGTALEGHHLESVLRATAFDATRAAAHTAGAEHFNYCFFYKSLRPWGTRVPPALREALQLQYSRNGSVDAVAEVRRRMAAAALSHQQRCGWVYLVWTGGAFDVVEFQHGSCPIGSDLIPLLAINMHESAYCIDYTNEESVERYVENFFKSCNWTLAERYYLSATDPNREQ